jgi:enhancing lycopene biosynthesis protein 2
MKRFAVVLAGCGVFDGAEIHEAILTLLAIAKQGASYRIFAPDVDQHHVLDHLTGKEMKEKRNVLAESARIARGEILPLVQFNPDDFDALVFPGGFGVAKNLCTFAFDGPDCRVNPDVERTLRQMKEAGKPIGAMCISPVLLARTFPGAELTLGDDRGSIEAVEAMGAAHRVTTHGEVVVDRDRKFFSTPCYMLDASITDIAAGTENLVKEMLKAM